MSTRPRQSNYSVLYYAPVLLLLALFAGMGLVKWWREAAKQHEEVSRPQKLWDPEASAVERMQAAESYARQGVSALPDLRRALNDDRPAVRSVAAMALSRMKADARDAVPDLVQRLSDKEPRVRQAVAVALGEIQHDLEHVTPLLVARLADENHSVRQAAESALKQLGRPAATEVCKASNSSDSDVRRRALMLLKDIGSPNDGASVEVLRKVLNDPDQEIRDHAFFTLYRWRALTVDELVEQLGGSKSKNVGYAAALLQQWDYSDPKLLSAIPQLQHVAASEAPAYSRFSRIVAAKVLAQIGAPEETFLPVLTKVFVEPSSNKRDGTRWDVADFLATSKPELAKSLVPAIVAQLEDEDAAVRSSALRALLGLGFVAEPAMPALIKALKDDDFQNRQMAADALARIGPAAKDAVPALIELLQEADFIRQPYAEALVTALGAIGPAADAALPQLIKFVRSRTIPAELGAVHSGVSDNFVAKTITALGQIGPGRDTVIEVAVGAFSHPAPYIRAAAVSTLATSRSEATRTAQLLARALHDDDPRVQVVAALHLAEIPGETALALQELEAGLGDIHPYVRTAAARALGRIGPPARIAVPKLLELLEERESDVPNSEAAASLRSTAAMTSFDSEFWYDPEFRETSVRAAVIEALKQIEPELEDAGGPAR